MTEREGAEGLAATIGDGSSADRMLREILEGLSKTPKEISSKYHYDERGSELFEEITQLEEYYPTRTEQALLQSVMPLWVAEERPAALVELGAGSAEKSRIILDEMVATGAGEAYVPVDVSHDFLKDTARRLEGEYPSLAILPTVADITSPVSLPDDLPGPSWIGFLGSTLGNFDEKGSADLLRRIRSTLRADDRFLLGVDLRPGTHKTAERIELAYNDSAGVTAAFSLNVLAVLNEEVGTDFDPSRFRHRSRYVAERGRIETHLESLADQTVSFADGTLVEIAEGELLRTEISCKYDRPTIDALFTTAELAVSRWVEDELGYYALVLARPAAAP